MRTLVCLLLALAIAPAGNTRVHSVQVRILSTMLTSDEGFGEWGFSALVIADGHKILFDTGAHPDTVLRNIQALKIDLSDVPDVILSHHHLDHTAGLITLRKSNPSSLGRVHTGQGILLSRTRNGRDMNKVPGFKAEFEATGGSFVEYATVHEMYPGIWLTGPVPRKYPERNWSGSTELHLKDGTTVEDNLPEDQSLVIDTDKGLVVISGCGHSGIINTLDYSRAKIRNAPVYAALGGFHLYQASEDTLTWTAGKLKEFGVANFLGAHCTGIEAVFRLRQLTGLTRQTAAVGAVGGGFTLDGGLDPGSISK